MSKKINTKDFMYLKIKILDLRFILDPFGIELEKIIDFIKTKVQSIKKKNNNDSINLFLKEDYENVLEHLICYKNINRINNYLEEYKNKKSKDHNEIEEIKRFMSSSFETIKITRGIYKDLLKKFNTTEYKKQKEELNKEEFNLEEFSTTKSSNSKTKLEYIPPKDYFHGNDNWNTNIDLGGG